MRAFLGYWILWSRFFEGRSSRRTRRKQTFSAYAFVLARQEVGENVALTLKVKVEGLLKQISISCSSAYRLVIISNLILSTYTLNIVFNNCESLINNCVVKFTFIYNLPSYDTSLILISEL